MTLFKHECRQNRKTMLIWTAIISFICWGCLLLYNTMEGSLDDMNKLYESLGPMAAAVGLDKLGINTVKGYYATEIAIMFSLGGGMYAALTGAGMLAKEEEGHTAEFLHTFPISRSRIVASKYLAMAFMIFSLNAICMALCFVGVKMIGGGVPLKTFLLYHGLQYLMQLELASIAFLFSSGSRKKMAGVALGITILLYAADMMCRIIPDIEGIKYVTPFYYSNAADIFSSDKAAGVPVLIGCVILLVTVVSSFFVYEKRDIQ